MVTPQKRPFVAEALIFRLVFIVVLSNEIK